MNRTAAVAAIKALPGMTAKVYGGEFRITFTVAEMMRREGIERTAAIARCEDVAAYETDPESAVDTARAMLAVAAPDAAETVAREAAADMNMGTEIVSASAVRIGTETTDETGRQYIDMTPTWSGMFSTFRMLIENGNAEGRATAWKELARMAALADERNTLARTLETLTIAANETAHCVPAGMARDELDTAIAAGFAALGGKA